MMVKIGNFLFHYRNFLFPVFYACLFIPSPRIFPHSHTAVLVGLIVTLAGQAVRVVTIGLVYIKRGGQNRRIYADDLVSTGIFSHCRNPLYVGNILILLGVGIIANSMLFLAVLMPIFLFFYQAIVLSEENYLLGKFGDAYREYTSNTNRWIPNLSGIGATLKSMTFNWRRVIIREYTSAFIWMLGALAVTMVTIFRSGNSQLLHKEQPFSIVILCVLILTYSIVRYLKKNKYLTEQK